VVAAAAAAAATRKEEEEEEEEEVVAAAAGARLVRVVLRLLVDRAGVSLDQAGGPDHNDNKGWIGLVRRVEST
jgi:hypothetical protein